MDSELYAMLKLYQAKDTPLTIHEVAIILGSNEMDVTKPIKNLFDSGYLYVINGYVSKEGAISVDAKLRITYAGELAIREAVRANKRHFWIEFRAWITLAIALVALATSIASVLLQLK